RSVEWNIAHARIVAWDADMVAKRRDERKLGFVDFDIHRIRIVQRGARALGQIAEIDAVFHVQASRRYHAHWAWLQFRGAFGSLRGAPRRTPPLSFRNSPRRPTAGGGRRGRGGRS